MKIFITGVAGFLGSHLADRMIELGHTVAGNDALIGGYIDNVDTRVDFYEIDCCDQEQMVKVMEGVDVVVHTAATAHEGLSVFSPDFITRNIFQASVSTISAAISAGVKRFVYCSSMARYGNQPTPFLETYNTAPVDPYGIAKVAGEDVLKVLCNTHGMEWNIAVPHNIVGPRQRYDDPFRNVMSIMINRNLQGKPAIIYGDGNQTRCFSYIDDCIYCLEKLVLDNIVSETVNIGPDEGTITINELAKLVARECNFTKPFLYFDERPLEVKDATCSSNKARKLLGYKTTVPIKYSVKYTVDWIKNRGSMPFDYSFPLEIINDKTPKTWKDRLM
jgi:UDP-glucose 4-epimerase|tara:strand:+ start:762 stop:1760 length:999 start_codon:yes stop_codon:yes gene_type:complete